MDCVSQLTGCENTAEASFYWGQIHIIIIIIVIIYYVVISVSVSVVLRRFLGFPKVTLKKKKLNDIQHFTDIF